MATEFALKGETYEQATKWGAWIKLTTPDGKVTKIDSGPVYPSDQAAAAALQLQMNTLLVEFKKDGTEVVAKDGVPYQ